jgi:sterol desaturase/sphingolipid hydroxylase (fatty acid hydroxylase superfamily)
MAFQERFREKLGEEDWRRIQSVSPLVISCLLLTVLLILALIFIPQWQVRHYLALSQSGDPFRIASQLNEDRKTLVQILGGIFAIFALYYTWRRVVLTEQGHIGGPRGSSFRGR